MEQLKTEQNDWENDDDDWGDDWGDAEDNEIQSNIGTQQIESASNIKQIAKGDVKTTTNVEQNVQEKEIQSPREDTSNRMLGMLKTLTTSVSQGINQVIGVPDPEELARINCAEASAKAKENKNDYEVVEQQQQQTKSEATTTTTSPIFGMDLVSGVTTLGSTFFLDTLEGIGRKTMNMLQENDPLLMKKRKLLGLDAEKPNLSAVLQEAKKDADQLEHTLKQLKIEKSKTALRFDSLFENNCGLMHLEALEILSKESELKLKKLLDAISGQALLDLRETINEVKELMQMEDLESESDGNFSANELLEQLAAAVKDADLNIDFVDVVKSWSETLAWLDANANLQNELNKNEEVFAKALTLQAEICASEMNKLHKIGEILLIKEHHSTASEVDAIVQLCKQFNMLLNGLTNRFANILTNTEEGKQLTSNLFSEMLLATQQIEKAFKLFLPILQIGAV